MRKSQLRLQLNVLKLKQTEWNQHFFLCVVFSYLCYVCVYIQIYMYKKFWFVAAWSLHCEYRATNIRLSHSQLLKRFFAIVNTVRRSTE